MSLYTIWDNLFSLSPTNFFSALRGLVWSKNRGGGGGALQTIKRMQYGLTFFPLRKFQQQTDQTFLGKEANL